MKRFHDWHLDWGVMQGRLSNFIEPQMGWWQPRLDEPGARGHFSDEMEYFAAKNAGHDAAMSIQGVSARPLPVGLRRQLTLLGWYEHARLARCFTSEAMQYLSGPKTESRFRQDDDGVWRMTQVECFTHRAGFPWTRQWTLESGMTRPTAMRVEALYGVSKGATDVPVLSPDGFAAMEAKAAQGVTVKFEPSVPGEHGTAFRLSAQNEKVPQKGAWAVAKRDFAFPGLDLGEKRTAFGVWVKGDGSGALLNLQFSTPVEFVGGISDHCVRLDFTGWKYVTVLLRERDSALYSDYLWPYGGGYASIYINFVNPRHLASFATWINDIPTGSGASVEIGEVKALEQVPVKVAGASVVVNGEKVSVPFEMLSGEYAELEEDLWTHYSAKGDKIAVAPAVPLPVVRAGANELAFEAFADARAEVTLFALGEPRPAFVADLTDEMRKELRYEGLMPFEYAPAKRFFSPKVIPVRPGETAALNLEIYGPCERPTFTFKSFFGLSKTVCAFDTAIAADEKLVCRDGFNWVVEKAKDGTRVRDGRLGKPLPRLSGSRDFEFTASVPDGGVCTVDIMKDYAR